MESQQLILCGARCSVNAGKECCLPSFKVFLLAAKLKPLSHIAELWLRVTASYNSYKLALCCLELVQVYPFVVYISPVLAHCRQVTARILNRLKFSCDFSSRSGVVCVSRECLLLSSWSRRHVFLCRRFSPSNFGARYTTSLIRVVKTSSRSIIDMFSTSNEFEGLLGNICTSCGEFRRV